MDVSILAASGGTDAAVPGVAIVGLLAGLALLYAAIRLMFGKKK